ncbi:branched-chain amino acid ABC transporter [Brucella sp. 191011898]|nr:branched-chain amino acid ABC transporter permease [Brucella sp. 191011898]CAB4327203.1 branched-chain amino acid ABC transporter [Brucella sp. 191011898]
MNNERTLPAAAMPSLRSNNHALQPLIVIGLAMVLFATAVSLLANAFWLSATTSAMALSLSVAGVALLYGQLGLVSLCQFALVGVGGWVTLRIGHGFHPPFEISLMAGGVAAAFIGLLFGIPALRLRGLYLALVTLMLAGAFQIVISAWGFPDGGPGFLGRADGAGRAMLARPALATEATPYFLYTCLFATLGLMLVQAHKMTRPGRAWALIRKGETVAISSGVNVLVYKAWAFALSGFLAGIAGGLLAGNVGQLEGRAFSAFESLNLFALATVGGAFHWYGAIIAGLLLRALPALLTDLGIDGYVTIGIFGVALFHALATAPSGIAGQIAALLTRFTKREPR